MKLLNNKRSQAVGILMSSLHLDMKDIQHGECFFPLNIDRHKQEQVIPTILFYLFVLKLS